jgi:hypothetical protein
MQLITPFCECSLYTWLTFICGSSPTLPSFVHCCVLKWKLTFTLLHSICFVGILPSNIHHASLRDRLSSGRSTLHDLSHFFKRITLFDTECRVKAQTLSLTPPWPILGFEIDHLLGRVVLLRMNVPNLVFYVFATLKHPSRIPARQAFIG